MCVLLQLFVTGICLKLGGSELLKDPGFEESSLSSSWECAGCTFTHDGDHTEGHNSVKVTGRQAYWAGVLQAVPLRTNTRYFFQAHIKQLNDEPGQLFQRYTLLMCTLKNNGSREFSDVIDNQAIRVASGWTVISGYFLYRGTDYKKVTIRINGPHPVINFLVDDMSLTEIPEDKNWKSEADARIEKIRKSNIHFTVSVPPHVSAADLDIQLDLVKHSFPFGSQTSYETMNAYPHYNDLFYYMFNWATVNDFYWYRNPQPRHNPYYNATMAAIDTLHRHGVSVRGHNIFWGTGLETNPAWVHTLNSEHLKHAVDERIQYIVRDTKGRVEHWDVNNELLHGHWYEEQTHDPYYSQTIFGQLHKADPNTKLFLNDFSVVSSGESTTTYVAQASEFKAANVGLYGLGFQCHFPAYLPPDPTLVKKRLDQLAKVGLPLWATEMDLVAHDENTRADWYDTALRLLFSHPSVEGIILWGFWDVDHWRGPDAALVNGPKFHVNAAGLKYIDLLYKEWSTHVTHKVSSGKQFDARGFHGDYRIVVNYHGYPIKQQTFTLDKQDKHVNVDITNVHNTVNIQTTKSPVIYTEVEQHPVAHIHETTMGHMTSGSSNHLACINRYSEFSEVADDKFVKVGCPSGYVLTGCSGKIRNNQDTRDGERIILQSGAAMCLSYDAGGSSAPVQAIARCCKLTGLDCDYRKSGPSNDVLNQRIITECLNNKYATGCAAHSFFQSQDGAFPSTHSCFAQNQNNLGNVESFAACCSAPHMTCKVIVSKPAGDKLGDQTSTSCDHGWEMMGCSSYSDDSKLGGAYIEGNPEQCVAVNGAVRLYKEMGATAYATCCRVH